MSQPHMPPPQYPPYHVQTQPPRKPGMGKKLLIGGAAGFGGLVLIGAIASAFGAGETGTGSAAGTTTEPAVPSEPTAPTASATAGQAAAKPPAAKPSKAAPKPASGIGKPYRDGKFQFTVTKVKPGVREVGDDILGKKAQGQYVVISLTVENIGDKPQSLMGDAQKLYDDQGREFSADTEAGIYADAKSFIEEINPGNTVRGVLLFDLPKGAKPARLELHDSIFSGGVEVALK